LPTLCCSGGVKLVKLSSENSFGVKMERLDPIP
jgi:hypothetical protein